MLAFCYSQGFMAVNGYLGNRPYWKSGHWK